MERELLDFLSRARRESVTLRGGACELRILPAREVLALRREIAAQELSDAAQQALFANAALLSRALFAGEEPVFADGEAVLQMLGVGEINALVERYALLDGTVNPTGEDGRGEIEALKKA